MDGLRLGRSGRGSAVNATATEKHMQIILLFVNWSATVIQWNDYIAPIRY